MLPLLLLCFSASAFENQQSPARDDAKAILLDARNKILQTVQRLPKYLCTETVDRVTFQPETPVRASSCDELAALRKKKDWKARQHTSDRLRIDVAVAGDGEMYSWVGENHFSDRSLADLVRSGATSTGAFASFLGSIFGSNDANFTYNGDVKTNGRTLAEFGFRVPVEKSKFTVANESHHAVVGYGGTFLIDSESSDLVQLTVLADQLPAEVGACESETTLNYAYIRLNASQFLIPTEVRWRIVEPDGKELESRTVFSGCHEFVGQSTLRFNTQPGSEQALIQKTTAKQPAIPPGLGFIVALAHPIDTLTAAAGDPIQTTLTGAIKGKHPGVFVPKGTVISGRIMRIERIYGRESESLVLAIQLESMEVNGVRQPFAGKLESAVRRREKPVNGLVTRQDLGSFDQMLDTHGSGVGFIQFDDVTKDFVIPRGLEIAGTTGVSK